MIIDLNSNFYNFDAVKKTAFIFEREELGNFKVYKEGKKIKVKIRNINKELKEPVRMNFFNYALSETINYEK